MEISEEEEQKDRDDQEKRQKIKGLFYVVQDLTIVGVLERVMLGKKNK